MRIALDATPAGVQRAGVGRYARELIRALVDDDTPRGAEQDEFLLVMAAERAAESRLLAELPPGAWRETRRLPLSERWMTALWQRLRAPLPVERLVGPFDVFHGTDFVLPPTRRPAVVTIHDLSYLRYPEFAEPRLAAYLRAAVPRSVARADAVVTVSASVAADVAAAYPAARDKLAVVHNGVRVPPAVARRAERPLILAVGTVEPRKNYETLIRAIEIVRERCADAQLVIAGRVGWRSTDTLRAIRDAERAGGVRFVEGPDDAMLDSLYASAAVVATAAWHEGFGLPALEAMARGVPVVASGIPALREVGADAAVYADPARPEAFAAELVALLDDSERRALLGDAGRHRAASFSWGDTARRTRRVYGAVAARRG